MPIQSVTYIPSKKLTTILMHSHSHQVYLPSKTQELQTKQTTELSALDLVAQPMPKKGPENQND